MVSSLSAGHHRHRARLVRRLLVRQRPRAADAGAEEEDLGLLPKGKFVFLLHRLLLPAADLSPALEKLQGVSTGTFTRAGWTPTSWNRYFVLFHNF